MKETRCLACGSYGDPEDFDECAECGDVVCCVRDGVCSQCREFWDEDE